MLRKGAELVRLASVQFWEWPRPLSVGVFVFTDAHVLVCMSNMEDKAKSEQGVGVINATVLTGVVLVVVVDSSDAFLSKNFHFLRKSCSWCGSDLLYL